MPNNTHLHEISGLDGAEAVIDLSAPIPGEPRFLRADAGPLRIGLRGDALAHDLVLGQRPCLPTRFTLISAEAVSLVALATRIDGHGPDAARALAHCRTDSMPLLLRDRFLGQFEDGLLKAPRLDLLVIDTDFDCDTVQWRHREGRWLAWFPPTGVHDRAALDAEFEPLEMQSSATLAAAVVILVRTLRLANPELPVLLLHRHDGSVANGSPASQIGNRTTVPSRTRHPVSILGRSLEALLGRSPAQAGLYLQGIATDALFAEREATLGHALRAAWSAGMGRQFIDIPAPAAPGRPPAGPRDAADDAEPAQTPAASHPA